jgi:NitT/TauT family transport system substrate-binding protein
MRHRRSRVVRIVVSRAIPPALVATAALALAACGSGSSDSGSSSTKEASAPLPTVTIASAAATPIFAQPYLAQALGYFRDAGVNVKIQDNTGGNTLNFVASGQADLGMIGAAAPLLLAQQGKDSKIVYSPQSGGSAGMLVGGKGIKAIADLKGKRIGTLAKGSSTYGLAAYYSQKYGLGADLVPLPNNAALTGALKSGQIAGATGPSDSYATLVDAGDATILVDTRDKAERQKIIGADYPEGAVFGLAGNLTAKREAIVGVLAAYGRALEYFRSQPPEEVAKTLRTQPGFKATPLAALTGYVTSAKSYVGVNDGYISPAAWKAGLAGYALWGLGDFSASNPLFAYDKRIDMTYLDAAKKDTAGAAK